MAKADCIAVQVVYALPDKQVVVDMSLPAGATVSEAIERSELLRRFPDIDLAQQRIGIFSRLVSADAGLKNGDRVEIYRPLTRDPKEARRALAREGRSMGRQQD